MADFDSNKSIILWCQGQSNMAGRGQWTTKSTTGLYNTYAALEGLTIDSKILCTDNMIPGSTFTSLIDGDLFELGNTAAYNGHTGDKTTTIGMMFSFVKDLIDYLNGVSYTKNVWLLNHGLGGTSLRNISDQNWGWEYGIFQESADRLRQIIQYEKDVNGNDSQVICFWHQGEADVSSPTGTLDRLKDLYARQKAVIGYNHHLFYGQLVPDPVAAADYNDFFFDHAAENDKVHVVGEDLPGGISTWQDMENNDPDGVIDASNAVTYTDSGDQTHYSWTAQILQGKQLYDLVINRYFT